MTSQRVIEDRSGAMEGLQAPLLYVVVDLALSYFPRGEPPSIFAADAFHSRVRDGIGVVPHR